MTDKSGKKSLKKILPNSPPPVRFDSIWLLILLMAILIVYPLIFRDVFFGRQEEVAPKQVSVIMRDLMLAPGEQLLREGMEQAALENNLELNYISLAERQNADEQISYLRREIGQKVDGIILLPTDTAAIAKHIDFDQLNVPIVQLDGPPIHNKVLRVGANPAKVSEILIGEIQRQQPEQVYLIYQDDGSVPADLLQIIENEFVHMQQPYKEITLNEDYVALGQFEYLCRTAENTLFVLLDDYIPESWIPYQAIKKNSGNSFVAYSYNNDMVDKLEQNLLQGIIFENPFNLGHNGVSALGEYLATGSFAEQEPIDVYLLTKENLYDKETQHIIFPY